MNSSKTPPIFPQRVLPELLVRTPSNDNRNAEVSWALYSSDENLEHSSSEIDPEVEVKRFDANEKKTKSFC